MHHGNRRVSGQKGCSPNTHDRRRRKIARACLMWYTCALFLWVCCWLTISSPNAWSEAAHHASWTSAEKVAWAHLRSSGRAELGPSDELSGTFLREIITDPDLTKDLKTGVTVHGGKIVGPLNLKSVKVSLPLVDLETRFSTAVDISDATFDGTLSFRGADLNRGIIATRSRIEGSLVFGKYDDTEYLGDRIAGGNNISSISASHIRVNGDVILSGVSISQDIDFSLSNIKGTLTTMYVDAQSANISAAEVGNQLIVFASTFRRKTAIPGQSVTLNFYDTYIKHGWQV